MSDMNHDRSRAGAPTQDRDNKTAVGGSAAVPTFPLWHDMLAGRYRIDEIIGHGEFGITYKGYDTILDQTVAIKEYFPHEFAFRGEREIIPYDGEATEQYKKGLTRFVEEARKLAAFRSEKGIVQIIDCVEENGTAYIIMEYLEGILLEDLLKKTPVLDETEAIELLKNVMDSLSTVHQSGIIHRNICPENLFVMNDGTAKLIDFGASRDISTGFTRSLSVTVNFGYSPEEQYRGLGEQGPHTDVYSLAATLYRMTTGKVPPDVLTRTIAIDTKGKDPLTRPRKLNPKISPVVENALLNALNISIEDRTKTVREFRDALLKDKPSSVRKTNVSPSSYRIPRWLIAFAASLFTLLAVLTVLLATGRITFDSGSPLLSVFDRVSVPNVIGLSQEEAITRIQDVGLTPVASGNVASDYIETGKIVYQSPQTGRRIARGDEVLLTVSSGSAGFPYVVWDSLDEAIRTLVETDYITETLSQLELVYVWSDTVEAGYVVSQSVTDRALEHGEKLVLEVSSGPGYGVDAMIPSYYYFYPELPDAAVSGSSDTSGSSEETGSSSEAGSSDETGNTSPAIQYASLDFHLTDADGAVLEDSYVAGMQQYLINYETREVFPYTLSGNNYSLSLLPGTEDASGSSLQSAASRAALAAEAQPSEGWYFWIFVRDGRLVSYYEDPVYLADEAEEASGGAGDADSGGSGRPASGVLSTGSIDVALALDGIYVPNGASESFAGAFSEYVAAAPSYPFMSFASDSFDYSCFGYGLILSYGSSETGAAVQETYFPKLLPETQIQMFLIDADSHEIISYDQGVDGSFDSLSPGTYYCYPVFPEESGLSYSGTDANYSFSLVVELLENDPSLESKPLFACILFYQDDWLSSPFRIQVIDPRTDQLGFAFADFDIEEDTNDLIINPLDENGYLCHESDSGLQIIQIRVPLDYSLQFYSYHSETQQVFLYGPAVKPPADSDLLLVNAG